MRVFIISDLHLGGRWGKDGDRGFRMMTCPERLARFIDRVADEAGPAELVINGDFIDFLAEENVGAGGWQAFVADQHAVAERLRGLTSSDPDGCVFDALERLLAKGKGLTLLLGNHDLELGLPAVRARLEKRLGQGRLRFITDGEAYVVGDALIEHGNRYDNFNVVDHDALRRLRSLLSRGTPTAEALKDADFEPPVGSELVATLMNPIKEELGFVDQLKPEGAGLYGLLLALRPGMWRKLDDIARFAWRARKRGPEADRPAVPGMPGAVAGRGQGSLWQLLRDEGYPAELVAELKNQLDSGAVAATTRTVLLSPTRRTLLRAALRRGDLQAVWDPAHETGIEYRKAAQALATRGFRYVVFGHTHYARDVALPGGARYLNSGTWANLMRFPPGLADATDAALDQFCTDLENNAPLGKPEPHAVELVVASNKVVSARLLTPGDLP